MENKQCKKCNKLCSINLFTKEQDRYRNVCNSCRLEQVRIRRNNIKETNAKIYILLTEKQCYSCKKVLEINNFYKQSSNKDGYKNYCISCFKLKRKNVIKKNNPIINSKICIKCNIDRPITEFKPTSKSKDGFFHKCKSCWTPTQWTKEKQQASEKKYRTNNPDKIKEKYKKQGLKIHRRLRDSLNHRISDALKAVALRKDNKTMNYVGCSLDLLKNWFQYLFEEHMTFDNYGKWHIDHIKPCCSFDLTNDTELKECFNWKNLRPCWADENLEKSSQINTELIEKYKNKANIFLNNLLPNQSSNSIGGAN